MNLKLTKGQCAESRKGFKTDGLTTIGLFSLNRLLFFNLVHLLWKPFLRHPSKIMNDDLSLVEVQLFAFYVWPTEICFFAFFVFLKNFFLIIWNDERNLFATNKSII